MSEENPSPEAGHPESELSSEAEALLRIEEARRLGSRRLDLFGLGLTALPGAISQLGQLHELYLSDNRLTTLPEAIGELARLDYLGLFDNALTELPVTIGRLVNLRVLDLSNNQLRALPLTIHRLHQLETLKLTHNQLWALPEAIGGLKQLQTLNLTRNQLEVLPDSIGQLYRLETLDLYINRLMALPEAIGNLRQLQALNVAGNQLRMLPERIGELVNLQTLDLSYNQLRTLPETVGDLDQLQMLDLSGNQLTALPTALRNLTNLRELFLHENTALGLPNEILGPSFTEVRNWRSQPKSPAQILDYYFAEAERATLSGKQPLNEAKVLVLGEAQVGKSSLILALTEKKLRQPVDMTHGIVQRPWKLPLRNGHLAPAGDNEGDETLRLNLWDFGGQEVYHSTHSFFLTLRAVYLLVADARANDRQNNLEYWLQMAKSFGAGAPIWVVVNKCDQHGAGPDEHPLQRKFPMIRGFLRTSCWTGEGLERLRETLAAEALSLEDVRQPMNNIWLGIKRALEEMKQDTLPLADYLRLCSDQGETEAGIPEKLLDLWDKLGTVRYFPTRTDDPPAMRDAAILNPEWVTKAVYAVLDDPAVRAAGGIATESDFARILQAGDYPPEGHGMIEHVMRRFDLLYDTPEFQPQHRMLVPQLLPEREPEHIWAPRGTLCFVYRYPVLPAALVPSFIARRHRLLSNSPGPWRHGCLLDFSNGARARIIGDVEKKEVTISVMGEPIVARDALDAVRATFEEMHSTIDGLLVEELIPVPGRPDAPLIGYRHLRALEVNGIPKHYAHGVTASEIIEVDVREALNAARGVAKTEAERAGPTFNFFDNSKPNIPMSGDINQQNIGGGSFYGPVAAKMENCTNIINQQTNGERRDLLQTLERETRTLIAKLPEDKQAGAADDFELLLKGADEKSPNRRWYSVSAEGLLEASKFVKDFTGSIAGTIGQLGKLIWPDFSLPQK